MRRIRTERPDGKEGGTPRRSTVAVLVCALTLFAGGVAYGRGAEGQNTDGRVTTWRIQTLEMLHIEDGFKLLDVGRPWKGELDPSPGDTAFLRYELREPEDTQTLGEIVSKCVATSGTEFKCAGTVFLEGGTVEVVSIRLGGRIPVHEGGSGRHGRLPERRGRGPDPGSRRGWERADRAASDRPRINRRHRRRSESTRLA